MKGIVLVVVIWVLALVWLLAVVFLMAATAERSVSSSYYFVSRAEFAARSGVESAVSRIYETIERGWLRGDEIDQSWRYGESVTTLLEDALKPSFAGESIKIGSKQQHISGKTSSDDVFKLKISDTQGQINVNDGTTLPKDHAMNKTLVRILNTLGRQVGITNIQLGEETLKNRPSGGYQNKYELLKAVGGKIDLFNRFKDHVTTNSWKNPSVAMPVPLSSHEIAKGSYPISYNRPWDAKGPIYRYGNHSFEPLNTYARVFRGLTVQPPFVMCFHPDTKSLGITSYDALNPQWIELVERAPVNVNTASKEVLTCLIAGLQGFFIMNPKVGEPRNIFYYWMGHKYLYLPSTQMQSQIGSIYMTQPFVDGSDNNAQGFPAQAIADEIIACRTKAVSPVNIDYAQLPFGGPFRSWAQFNKFVDYLVDRGVLIDNRNIYFDEDFSKIQYTQTVMPKNYVKLPEPSLTIPSTAQRRMASQAMADVLKANFNPNLHLNELNQNKTLHMLVDKTDLIVNSTEFCFLPMGYFEIESLGLVLSSDVSDQDHQIMARKKINTMVKLYDVYYESDQARFHRGEFGDRKSDPMTNNGKAVETGPEVDNGNAPFENNYSGYLALSSNYGGQSLAKGALYTTLAPNIMTGAFPNAVRSPPAVKELDANIVSHFRFDHVANYHSDGIEHCKPIGLFPGSSECEKNFKDRTEGSLSPYSSVNGERFRLCRTYKHGDGKRFYYYSPSDLRVDGAYFEFNSAIGYKTPFFRDSFVASFWIKPNFYPELTPKVRAFLSFSDLTYSTYPNNYFMWRIIDVVPYITPSFGLFYFPSYHGWEDPWNIDAGTYNNRTQNIAQIVSASKARRNSLGLFGSLTYRKDASGKVKFLPLDLRGGLGTMTPTLNHNFETYCANHPASGNYCGNPGDANHKFETKWRHDRFTGDDGRPNLMRDHEWMHITVAGKIGAPKELTILVNGKELPNTDLSNIHIQDLVSLKTSPLYMLDFSKILGSTIRIGGEYAWTCVPSFRSYFADATIDEFYFWADNYDVGINRSTEIFNSGRYYRSVDSDPTDGIFTSDTIILQTGRTMAKLPVSPEVVESVSAKIKILGLNWTSYAEDYEKGTNSEGGPRLKPVMYNYNSLPQQKMSPQYLQDANGYLSDSICEVSIIHGSKRLGPFRNEFFSNTSNLYLDESRQIKYQLKFRTGIQNPTGTALLATPIFDDITVFFSRGGAEYLSCVDLEGPMPIEIGNPGFVRPPIPPPPGIDNQPPIALPISPSNNTTLELTTSGNVTQEYKVKVTDSNNNASGVTWFLNGVPKGTDYFTTPDGGDNTRPFAFTTPGDYKIVAVPVDKENQTGPPVTFITTIKPPPWGGGGGGDDFFGNPITAENIIFLIDMSGSMYEGLSGYQPDLELAKKLGITLKKDWQGLYTKWEVLKFEIKKALKLSTKLKMFNIVYFDHDYGGMNSKLIELNDTSMNQAFNLLNVLYPRGATNIYDSTALALNIMRDQKATLQGEIAIYLLSDGMPNTRLINPKIINNADGGFLYTRDPANPNSKYVSLENSANVVKELTKLNQDIKIKINTIAIPGSLFMRSISENNWGVYKSIP